VVRTVGREVSLMSALIWSRKPPTTSLFNGPTEMNLTGTPVATPTVYSMSRL
jgi:hypothetical protein